ncbi:MAG TPA: hypothetical protein VLV83_09965 [Acidobacteriota bacterium]|nr:hypothetical protein [Acidobacteriota bacterium]
MRLPLRFVDVHFFLLALLFLAGNLAAASGSVAGAESGWQEAGGDNVELAEMYKADQEARSDAGKIDWAKLSAEDEKRRERVKEMLEAGLVKTASDHYHAAMIMQHGGEPEAYELAFELSSKAAEMDPDHKSARWLSCAAEDRWLMSLGKPQVWGTQFKRPDMQSPWTMEPFDRDAKTDEERKACGVRTLQESEERLEAMNEQLERNNR